MKPRLFTHAEIAAVAKANHMPFVVAQDIAVRTALGVAIAYERRMERRKQLAEMAAKLEREEREQ